MNNISIETPDTARIFQGIIDTIPLPVRYGGLQFLAPGIPGLGDLQHQEVYSRALRSYFTGDFTEWVTHSIKPLGIQTREFKSATRASEPEEESVYRGGYAPDIQDTALDTLLRDGRTKVIKVDLGHHSDGEEGFQTFRESFFPRLKEAGYRAELGEFTFSSYGTGGFDSGTFTNSVVQVNQRGAFLNIGPEFDPAAKPVLVNWFEELKRQMEQKYREMR